MKTYKLESMKNGWFIGDFIPSVLKTKDFEVAVVKHSKGSFWPCHYHKVAKEINFIINGKMRIQDTELCSGDIFVIDPWEIADPVFHEDVSIVVIKVPSLVGDKYEV